MWSMFFHIKNFCGLSMFLDCIQTSHLKTFKADLKELRNVRANYPVTNLSCLVNTVISITPYNFTRTLSRRIDAMEWHCWRTCIINEGIKALPFAASMLNWHKWKTKLLGTKDKLFILISQGLFVTSSTHLTLYTLKQHVVKKDKLELYSHNLRKRA